MHIRPVLYDVVARLEEPRKFIQVLFGPRQVGKTTLALEAAKRIQRPIHYISADLASLQDLSWIRQQWEVAREKVDPVKGGLLIIDEVQKIPNWSDLVKALWDEDSMTQVNLSVMILGSSPWLVQKGMSESLAGRFEMIPITHWSFQEMQEAFGFTIDEYIYFGGYPGSAALINKKDSSRWMTYMNDSIIEMALSRDILLMTQVNKPALLRRLFQLGCNYSGQILSFSKIVGELQDAGNTTTLAHYLDLLSGAGLLAGLQKFSGQVVRQKGSSPKFAVYNTALMSAQSYKTYEEAKSDPKFWGRLVESTVGAHLLNAIRGSQTELFYWREGGEEVDFILRRGEKLTAIEVKSNKESLLHSGMDLFISKYKPDHTLLVGREGILLEDFLKTPLKKWI